MMLLWPIASLALIVLAVVVGVLEVQRARRQPPKYTIKRRRRK